MEIIDLEDDNGIQKLDSSSVGESNKLLLSFDITFNEEGFKKRVPIEIKVYRKQNRSSFIIALVISTVFLIIAANNYASGGLLFWVMTILSLFFFAVGISSWSDKEKEVKKIKERQARELRMRRKYPITHYEFTDDYFKKEDYLGVIQHYWEPGQSLVVEEEFCLIKEGNDRDARILLTLFRHDLGIDMYDETVTKIEQKIGWF